MSPSLASSPLLETLLRRATGRLQGQRMLQAAVWGLAVGALLAIGLILVDRLISPDWIASSFVFWILIASTGVGVLTSILRRRRGPLGAALAIERSYRLHERLSSIVLLDSTTVDPEAAEALLHDGERHADRVSLGKALPWRWPVGTLVATVLLAILSGVFLLPDLDLWDAKKDREQAAAEEKRVDERKKRLQKRMKELRKIAEKENFSPETRKLLAKMERQKLEASSARQKEAPKKRRALVEMQKMRDEVKSLLGGREMQKLGGFLDKVRAAGRKPRTEQGKKIARALAEGNLAKASEAMRELAEQLKSSLAKGGLDASALADLSQDLQSLSKRLGDLPSLGAQNLAKMLQKLSPQDLANLAKMLDGAAGDLSALARLMRERDLLNAAMAEISFTEDELAQMPKEWGDPKL